MPYSIDVSEWDAENHQLLLKGNSPERLYFLKELQLTLSREKDAFRMFVAGFEGKNIHVRDIISAYRSRFSPKGLTSLVDSLTRELIQENRERTARAYQTAWRRLLLYSGKKDLSSRDFSDGFIKGFERLLQAEKCSLNTISFYMRNLRAIYNKGKEKGFFPQDVSHPFRNVYTKVAPTRKRALSKEEISRLNNLNNELFYQLPTGEKDALHLFLFSFHACGMSFVDLAYLRKSDIRGNTLSYYRKKTGRLIQMKLSEGMKRSINYFSLRTKHSPYVFPVIQNKSSSLYAQYCRGLRIQNQRLKSIKDKFRIKRDLSTHMARHSWATIARSESVSVDIISEALGHSFVSTTYIYLDSFGSNVIGLANQKVSQAVTRFSSI
ncbi:MAG: site-specific integrase [Tannerellaceae bacterium]|nr:site-specific integrase [Tannerellaceae bacterium]